MGTSEKGTKYDISPAEYHLPGEGEKIREGVSTHAQPGAAIKYIMTKKASPVSKGKSSN